MLTLLIGLIVLIIGAVVVVGWAQGNEACALVVFCGLAWFGFWVSLMFTSQMEFPAAIVGILIELGVSGAIAMGPSSLKRLTNREAAAKAGIASIELSHSPRSSSPARLSPPRST